MLSNHTQLLRQKAATNILPAASRKSQAGATLIEALVSILLLSIGLLGIAGLQVNALTFQKSSWATNRISEITTDIAERMRANPDGVATGSYSYTASYAAGKSATITRNNCATVGGCSAPQIATDDLSIWLAKSQTTLPQGAVMLEGDANNGFVVTVMYQDKDAANSGFGTAATCTAATSGVDWRNCCPAIAAVPAGVRCSRAFTQPFIPQ
jgi:type IV pilus assembly protein PilV